MSNTPEEFPDVLVLAALDRAARHGQRRSGEMQVVSRRAVLAHLDLPMRSMGARYVKGRLAALDSAGVLERVRRHGVEAWRLTASGRRRLGRAQAAGRVPQLPESPQHRCWRNARTIAVQEVERARSELRQQAEKALALLDAERDVSSDAWFELAECLRRSARLVGSMTYCLYEWSEPEDAHADQDDHAAPGDEKLPPRERDLVQARRRGRRNPRLWRGRPE